MEEKKRRRGTSAKGAEKNSLEAKHSPRTSLSRSKGVNESPSRSRGNKGRPLPRNDMMAKPITSETKKFLEQVDVKTEVDIVEKRRRWPYKVAGVVCAIVVAVILYFFYAPYPYHELPCDCTALSGPLASALSSSRFGLTGFHVQQMNPGAVHTELTALSACAKVHHLRTPVSGVDALSRKLRDDAKSGNCHIWVAESVAVLQGAANALKELFEDNALRGEKILPEGARGIFLVLSADGREQLKKVLPHRVVHMLHTIAV